MDQQTKNHIMEFFEGPTQAMGQTLIEFIENKENNVVAVDQVNNNIPESLHIYTDGACSGNPGRGGWGVAVFNSGNTAADLITTHCGGEGEKQTTNNRMELLAIIKAINFTSPKIPTTIYSDSDYCIKGINQWLAGWKAKGWKTATRKPIKNQDLWRRLDMARNGHQIEFKWIKAHNGHFGNEMADKLAVEGKDV